VKWRRPAGCRLFSSPRVGATRRLPWALRAAVVISLATTFGSANGLAASGGPGTKPRIAFAGDSIVDNYWSGVSRLFEANSCLRGAAEFGRYARNGTGLTRGDRVYWPREVKRIGESFAPTLFVLSIGLNDRQFIVDRSGARIDWGAPNWQEKYRHEIVEFFKGAIAKNAIVLVVGLPAMRAEMDNADAGEKNAMFVDAINELASPRLQYVEPWRLKPTSPDVFASYGPDRNGKLVQIRTSDGQHFTVAGEDLVAAYLSPKIIAALRDAGIRLGECGNEQTKAE
jgi:hypothetical protein